MGRQTTKFRQGDITCAVWAVAAAGRDVTRVEVQLTELSISSRIGQKNQRRSFLRSTNWGSKRGACQAKRAE